MKINISKASEKELKKFDRKAWHKADIEHYGRSIRWISKPIIFKAIEKGKIVGRINAKYDAGVVYIEGLIVAEGKRGQGIGRKLMEKVEKTGNRLGAHKIFLFTMEKWDSVKFYRSLGFKKTGNLPKHYHKRNFVIYSKMI